MSSNKTHTALSTLADDLTAILRDGTKEAAQPFLDTVAAALRTNAIQVPNATAQAIRLAARASHETRGIQLHRVRFFATNVDAFADDVEVTESEFEELGGFVSYQRHTLFNNGVSQICLTTDAESEDIADTESTLRARFTEEVQPYVIAKYGADDTVALDTAFNDWTDSLCKDGEISESAYDQVTRTDD